LLWDTLADVFGADTQLINLAAHTAQALKTQLATTGSLNDSGTPPEYKFYVSGEPGNFNKTARFLLRREIDALRVD